MDNSWIGLLIFIASWIGGRFLSERALKILSDEERGKLVAGFSKYRIFSLVGVILIVILYYTLRATSPESQFTGLPVFVGVLVLYLLASSIFAFRKLKSIGLPDEYINQFLLSTFVQYAGIFVFFAFLLNKYR